MTSDHFSAGVIFSSDEKERVWKILVASDARFLKEDEINGKTPIKTGKIIGGTNKDEVTKALLNETAFDTLKREIMEEAKLTVLECYFVHSYDIPGRVAGTTHTRYFYLVKRFSGSFPFDEIKSIKDGTDIVKIWWSNLRNFEEIIFKFPNHKEGYIKAFLKMAEYNEKFRQDNADMFARYSAMKFNK